MNKIKNGWLSQTRKVISPHFDERPDVEDISLLVIHYISLPPEQFGGGYVDDFFQGKLDPTIHPYFEEIYQFRVSAHCLIERDGWLDRVYLGKSHLHIPPQIVLAAS